MPTEGRMAMQHSDAGDAPRRISAAALGHEVRLLRYARGIVRDDDRAREIVQETFLRLCREDAAAMNGKLTPWLFTVTRNLALDELRRRKPNVSLDSFDGSGGQAGSASAGERDPSASLETADESARVLAMVDSLPEPQRNVLHLRFAGELSYREIAEITEQSVSHVGVLIHNAIKTLRSRLLQPAGTRGDEGSSR